jgi:hypothetical protein
VTRIVIAALAVTSLVLVVAQNASAADMPVNAPVYKAPPVVPAYNWAGWYTGLNIGGSSESLSNSLSVANAPPIPAFDAGDLAGLAANGSGSLNKGGPAGTVYLCHPFLVHAAQMHRGSVPRFMAQPPLHPAEPFQLDRANNDYSPVEMAIRKALQERRN